MTTQPEALRLADGLEMWTLGEPAAAELRQLHAAAAELRRLHEVNQELIAALKEMLDGENKSFRELCEQARAAIAKAEGELK
jgi:hypothetical protein